MKVLFDTSGGDNAPIEIIKGALEARGEFNIEIAFVGKAEEIEKTIEKFEVKEKFEIIDAQEKIENDEEPAFALRRKKNSSTVIGLNLLKSKEYDAFISAGSTGALLAGGLFIVGRIDNIKRAVLPTSLPNLNGKTMIIDSGANVDCSAEMLLQFAKMGRVYLEEIFKIKNPTVGLLNIGSEKGKGNALTKETYDLLEESNLNFIGNIEARDITLSGCDLAICDGFVGNVLLKNTEGVSKFVLKSFSEVVKQIELSEQSQVEIGKIFNIASKKLDASEVGGALLLGLNRVVVKAHGNADSKAIKNAVKVAIDAVENEIVDKIEKVFKGDFNER
ncbi:phosphate:acyl-[acyl carrier protein] acyltransferase [Anaerosphaera aminiphila DSM 21120]|uniref:Phosphate acyltransferase n=1 Tax=Anaerosphaera aminiphila DSM 21120 TaxID=1120995 RepID=A0A1M5RH93_9FIRM|nr:phosphate acyltransferase PlsX [Anaerosphaera aminiphila]SHH25588.1 phosphate:acyl-[acyl carrier protein] acyltransferase [Anaerosphaera aminiphila DSM 21120]